MMFQFLDVAILVVLYFILGWCHSYKSNKYSWVDFYWSSCFLFISFFIVFKTNSFPMVIIGLLYMVWSLRLSWHLFTRIKKEKEDPRYLKLKQYWSDKTPIYFLFVYLSQGLLALILSLPLALQSELGQESLEVWHIMGVVLFIMALIGESVADKQLVLFKAKYHGEKKVCREGLWRYSRHPNYFFELMVWFSYGVFSLNLGSGLLGFVPFLIMYVFITKITGIPYSEKQALLSRGKLYKDYQKKTNKLVPWFPKEEKT